MATGARVRGTYAKSEGRRREILQAATEVFSAAGFRGGSVREIAQRVGMSQAGLLHHFGTKEALLVAVLELRDAEARQRLHLDDLGGIDRIRAVIALIAYNASVPGLVQLYCMLSAEATASGHPAQAYFLRRYEWVIEMLGDAFALAAASGELRRGVDPGSAARALVALADGLQVQWLLAPQELDMSEELRRTLQWMFEVEL